MDHNISFFIIILLLIIVLVIILYTIHSTSNTIYSNINYTKDYLNKNTRFVSKTNYDIYYEQHDLPLSLPKNNDFDKKWALFLCRTIMSSYIYANSCIDNINTKLSHNTKNLIYGDLQLPDNLIFVKNVKDRAILLNVKNTNLYILSIRGTITNHDMIDDLDAKQTLYYDLDKQVIDKAYVHHGCYNNWIELHYDYNEIWNLLPNNSELAITGHSQGATHAIFTTVAYQRKQIHKNVKLMCYIYGSPRFGDNNFIEYIDNHIKNVWTIINEGDMITNLPFSTYYFDQNTYLYTNLHNKIIGEIQIGSLGLNHYINAYACMIDKTSKECPNFVFYQSEPKTLIYN